MIMAHAAEVDVGKIINEAPLSRYQLIVTILCGIIAMLDGFDAQSIAFVAPVITHEWALPASAFGPIFGAGMLGLMLGAMAFGTAADKLGRRRTIIWSMLLFAVLNFATAYANSFQSLLILRFLTGLGLGGATPNIVALTAEYAPERHRATLVNIMFCGFPLGSTLGGFLAAKMIPMFGWQFVFYLGGVLPLFFLVGVVIWLPESIRYLVGRGGQSPEIARILSRVRPTTAYTATTQFMIQELKPVGFTVGHLFRDGRTLMTCLLWIAFFMNLLVMMFLVNWLPSLLRESGIPIETAIISTPIMNLGGVCGSVALGILIDRLGPYSVLGTIYLVAAAAIYMAAQSGGNMAWFLPAVFVAGIGVVGGQNSMNALAANLYPTMIRSTGVGWAFGMGRIGAIVGPVVGGVLVASGWDTKSIILISAVPTVVTSIAIFVLGSTAGMAATPSAVKNSAFRQGLN